MLTPPPRLNNNTGDAGSFLPDSSEEQPAGSSSPVPGESNPGAVEDAQSILTIASTARKLASKYPTAVPEVQTINDALQKLQMKIMAVQPPSEVAAPPQ